MTTIRFLCALLVVLALTALGTAQSVTVAAAGDIACPPGEGPTANRCRMADTAALIETRAPDAVLVLGDAQYPDGSLEAFRNSYDLSWGAFKDITRPVAGNHEYYVEGALGYFSYFGAAAGDPSRGYYSFDLGAWHLIALNSNCAAVGGCGEGSAQLAWLEEDLRAHAGRCTLAYWHHPRFSSGPHGANDDVAPFWRALSAAGADLVISGHDHIYQRFAPQDADGNADTERGLRSFVVGTGGSRPYPALNPAPNSEVLHSGAFGVLFVTLEAEGYRWEFRDIDANGFGDAGEGSCR